MRIIVVGCGKIGSTILASLVAEGHDVVAVDQNPAVVDEITNIYDAMGVCGNGADCEALSEAGVEKAELVVAATDSDERNMLCCFIARRMGAKHTIARIRTPGYNDQSLGFLRQQLDLSTSINPELLAARELFSLLRLPSAINVETFSHGHFEMVELVIKEDSPLDGLRLIELRKKFQAMFLICVVQRGEEVYIPDGNFVLKVGDRIGLTATPAEIHKLLKILGLLQRQAKNVMILGASRTAYYLAKMLLASGASVKIVEQDREQCETFCEALPGVVMLHGDGAQQELLLEEGIGSMDAFVALTGMDEENILISFFAASQQVPKVISKVNRSELAAMAQRLGLDCIISPKKIVSDVLVRYARALKNSRGSKMETLYKLMDDKAEALEFSVGEDFKWCRIALKDMKFKPHILIGGIIRGRRPFIPNGEDQILPGDKVVVIAGGSRVENLSDIIQ